MGRNLLKTISSLFKSFSKTLSEFGRAASYAMKH